MKRTHRIFSGVLATLAMVAGSLAGIPSASAIPGTELVSLSFESGVMSPALTSGVTTYTVNMKDAPTYASRTTKITATSTNPATDLMMYTVDNGLPVQLDQGVSSADIPVSDTNPSTIVNIVVTPAVGPSTEYIITLVRKPWGDFLEDCSKTLSTPCIESVELRGADDSLVDLIERNLAVRLLKADDGTMYIFAGENDPDKIWDGVDGFITPIDETLKVSVNVGVDGSVQESSEISKSDMPATEGWFALSLGSPGTLTSEVINGSRIVSWSNSPMMITVAGNCNFDSGCENPIDVTDNAQLMTVLMPANDTVMPSKLGGGWLASEAQGLSLNNMEGEFSFYANGPHFKADGTTLNTASFTVKLPKIAVEEILGVLNPTASNDLYRMVRDTDTDISDDVSYTVDPVDGSITARVDSFGFSQPKFTWKAAAKPENNNPGTGSGGGGGGESPSAGITGMQETLYPDPNAAKKPNEDNTPLSTPKTRNPIESYKPSKNITVFSLRDSLLVADRYMMKSPTDKLSSSPVVKAKRNAAIGLVVPVGGEPNTEYEILIRPTRKSGYVSLGHVISNDFGQLALPVFSVAQKGAYNIAIVNDEIKTVAYIKMLMKMG